MKSKTAHRPLFHMQKKKTKLFQEQSCIQLQVNFSVLLTVMLKDFQRTLHGLASTETVKSALV